MNFKQFRAISNFCVNTVIVKNTFVTKRARQFFLIILIIIKMISLICFHLIICYVMRLMMLI